METDRIATPTPRAPAPDPDPADLAVEVDLSDTQSHLVVDPDDLADLVRRTLASEGVARASISLALVDDATIRVLNARHLGHDWPTDVISFGLSEPGDSLLSGELVVSAEMAAATARQAGADPRAELALYVVHGLLHLCGLDDDDPRARAEMRRREATVLDAAGLVNTFPLVGTASAADRGREGLNCPR
jgi:probable rRNA maturation factor